MFRRTKFPLKYQTYVGYIWVNILYEICMYIYISHTIYIYIHMYIYSMTYIYILRIINIPDTSHGIIPSQKSGQDMRGAVVMATLSQVKCDIEEHGSSWGHHGDIMILFMFFTRLTARKWENEWNMMLLSHETKKSSFCFVIYNLLFHDSLVMFLFLMVKSHSSHDLCLRWRPIQNRIDMVRSMDFLWFSYGFPMNFHGT